jgi:hypothetical protein
MSLTTRIVSGTSIITAYIVQHILLQSVIHQNLFTAFGLYNYRGADKSLARPGTQQATVTEDSEFHISHL